MSQHYVFHVVPSSSPLTSKQRCLTFLMGFCEDYKDAGDARAFSFLQMFKMLPQMKFPPNYILVENVVGFEVSVDSH